MVRRGAFLQLGCTTHRGRHTEITLQGVLNLDCSLRSFIKDRKRKLQTRPGFLWRNARMSSVSSEGRDVSPTSKILVEIQMKSSHRRRGSYQQSNRPSKPFQYLLDLQRARAHFDGLVGIPNQSTTISYGEAQNSFTLESTSSL